MYSYAPCSIDFVETAIFDPGVTVSTPVVLVSFAVKVKGVEIAVASSVTADVTVVSSGRFDLIDNDGEKCNVEDDVAAITTDDVVMVATDGGAVIIDDVGTIEVDDVVNDVAVFLTCAVDGVKVDVVGNEDNDVATVSTSAAEDTITVDEASEAVGGGVILMSWGGQ